MKDINKDILEEKYTNKKWYRIYEIINGKLDIPTNIISIKYNI